MSAVKKGEGTLDQVAEDGLDKQIANAKDDVFFFGALFVAALVLSVVVSIVVSALVSATSILNPPAFVGIVVLVIVFLALLATKSLAARYMYLKLISKK